MRVISVQQPWAQLIADRRRHVLVKTWKPEIGDRFLLHASHVRNDELCESDRFDYKGAQDAPINVILGVIEVRRVIDRGLARPSKFDVPSSSAERKKEYAIAVRTIEKFRKPIPALRPKPSKGEYVWEYHQIAP